MKLRSKYLKTRSNWNFLGFNLRCELSAKLWLRTKLKPEWLGSDPSHPSGPPIGWTTLAPLVQLKRRTHAWHKRSPGRIGTTWVRSCLPLLQRSSGSVSANISHLWFDSLISGSGQDLSGLISQTITYSVRFNDILFVYFIQERDDSKVWLEAQHSTGRLQRHS